ncbi:hypothetical protein TNCV_2680531 [Trichonephila clavipes]|uniref:Uncharacterized protein n=1 Tax=Trichonephila clavipes TaxID=2585209 RepID=A0A8X6SD41_TRICX|nr:hypothetical protein TNCV_2680531 [Trichonephila clavipes]
MMAFGDGQVSGCGNRFYIDNGHVSIDCVRSSFMKTHWEAAIARLTTTFVNNPFGITSWTQWRDVHPCPPKLTLQRGPNILRYATVWTTVAFDAKFVYA